MIDSLLLVLHYLKITFKEAVQFRANFISGVIGLGLSSLFQLVAAIVVIDHFGDAAGWDTGQVAFMFGLWRIQYGLMLALAGPTWSIEFLIQQGHFDRLLVRPRSVLLQLPGLRFSVSAVGQIMTGVAMAVFGAFESPIEWNAWIVPWLVVITISGTAIQIALWVIIGSFSFYHVRISSAIRQIDRTSWQINLFPLSVYAVALQATLTFVIPWGFMVFYPAHLAFGRETDFAGSVLVYLAPLAALATGVVAAGFWRRGLAHYQGAGGM